MHRIDNQTALNYTDVRVICPNESTECREIFAQGAVEALHCSLSGTPWIQVCLPIAYGSIAWQLNPATKKLTDPADPCTHQWSLYVRHPNGHDLSPVIQKVVFHLHPSFLNATREVTQPPFEVQEKGWGEFEATIEMFFQDPDEAPISVRHFLKLFHGTAPPPPTAAVKQQKPVVSEFYDEVVFTDPSVDFGRHLITYVGQTSLPRNTLDDMYQKFSDVEDLKRISAARDFVKDQLRVYKDQLLRLESEASEIMAVKQQQSS